VILAGVPVGLFHAPEWADHPARLDEAGAAADVFWALQSPWTRLVGMPKAAIAMLRAASATQASPVPSA